MALTRAADIPGGTLVRMKLDGGGEAVCLKAYREGKHDAVANYLVPLHPLPAGGAEEIGLVYVDPEQPFKPCPKSTRIDIGEADAACKTTSASGEMPVGVAFANPKGRWMKVLDKDSHLRPYAYVNLDTGEIRIRQEKSLTGECPWSVTVKKKLFGLLG